MLQGYYENKDGKVFLRGYDSGINVALWLSTPTYDIRKLIDKGISIIEGGEVSEQYPASWEDLYLSVGSGHIKASAYTAQNSEGKTFKNDLNSVYLSRLGSIIQGMRSACNNNNREDELSAVLNSFTPKKVLKYIINGTNTISLKLGLITDLHYKNSETGEELVLKDDEIYSDTVNRDTSIQHKFKLDLSEFLKEDIATDDIFSNMGGDETFSLQQIIEANPNKSYAWLYDQKYEIVTKEKRVLEICKEIANHDGIVSFDTETTGLDFTFKGMQGQGDRLVGMVFSIKEGESWYFPVAHKKIVNICDKGNEQFIIEKYFKYILENKEILCHNGAFDWKVMYRYGIFLNLIHDTQILVYLTLHNDNKNMKLKLKSLTQELLHRDSFELSDFVTTKWGAGEITFDDLDYEQVKYYACPDTDNTLTLFNRLMSDDSLGKYGAKKTYSIEVAFSLCIAYQEYYGHCIDVDRSEELNQEIIKVKEEMYEKMIAMNDGQDFNPNSSKDLNSIAFEKLNYPVFGKTPSGAPSLNSKIRERMLEEKNPDGSCAYPFIEYYEKYKEFTQLESNFIKNLDKFATEDGFIFSEVKQFLETGRVSVKETNYQSYNDKIKHYVIPREGYYALDADYSSVEYRILASIAGESVLIEQFKDPDMDYHTYQAGRMFRVPYELVTKDMRQNAKGINFGIPYGMGDWSLGKRLYGVGSKENQAKAAKMKEIYFEGQDNVRELFRSARAEGVDLGYSSTYFGRRRYLNRALDNKAAIERKAGNNRIQGTAADVYKLAMVRLLNKIRENGWLGKILITAFVHDECFLEIHKSIDPAIMLKTLSECMMLDIEGWCPLYIGAGFGTNWYDAKKTEIPVQVQNMIKEKYGETGLSWWDGNTDNLYNWECEQIRSYEKARVVDYMNNGENYGKVFSPIEGGLAVSVIKRILGGEEFEGLATRDIKLLKDNVDNLEQFCIAFGMEDTFKKANIQKAVLKESNSADIKIDLDMSSEEDLNPLKPVEIRLDSVGFALDKNTSKDGSFVLFIKNIEDDSFMDGVEKLLDVNKGNLKVLTIVDGEVMESNITTSTTVTPHIAKLYLQYKQRNGNLGRSCSKEKVKVN